MYVSIKVYIHLKCAPTFYRLGIDKLYKNAVK